MCKAYQYVNSGKYLQRKLITHMAESNCELAFCLRIYTGDLNYLRKIIPLPRIVLYTYSILNDMIIIIMQVREMLCLLLYDCKCFNYIVKDELKVLFISFHLDQKYLSLAVWQAKG